MSVAHLNYHHLPARSSIDAYVKSTFELRMGPQATKCGGHRGGAREKLDYFLTNLVDIALIEQPPTMEGRTMAIIMATKPPVIQRLQSQRAQRDRERAALG